MRFKDIRRHLKSYSISASRTTTINHAFAAAIAPSDSYDEQAVRDAIEYLGQNPDGELACAYCGEPAETWDHVYAIVRNGTFSGFGHRLGNLLPCCKPCNSRKGNRDWREYLERLDLSSRLLAERKAQLDAYLSRYKKVDKIPKHLPEYEQVQELRRRVLKLFSQADKLAAQIRKKSGAARQRKSRMRSAPE